MIIYHGSDHIIEKPVFHGGKRTNDYGYGFYTTENADLAKEWACARNTDGYANQYELNLDGLKVLNLNSDEYTILNWLAVLTRFRSYWQKSSLSEEAKDYLQEHFYIDVEQYDLIIGYRADDSYFSFAQDFIAGAISLQKLSEAMRLGKLGEQVVLKSEKAFDSITFLEAVPAVAARFYEMKAKRDLDARRAYRDTRGAKDEVTGLFMIDIMRERIENGDPRLR
ncbi:MAG: DUF3990 domain-containing protein [Lachnospiraceae bacterium]|nr:DUF3990 domain-containing protein [Lachnospiraceae bacterium]